jgi:glycosyltransferase involved in cell wall biosynthesis
MTKKLAIVIPVYNEQESISNVINEWKNVIPENDLDLIIVNDGSTDNTQHILTQLEKTLNNLVIINKENGGFGSAINTGYKHAYKQKYEFTFQTDSDQQFSSEDFNLLWKRRNLGFDLIIGNRFKRNDPYIRVFLSKIILRIIIIILFRKNIIDAGAPYRLIRTNFLNTFFKYETTNSAHPNINMAIIASNLDSLNVNHYERKYNEISWPLKKLILFGIQLIKDLYFLKIKINKS